MGLRVPFRNLFLDKIVLNKHEREQIFNITLSTIGFYAHVIPSIYKTCDVTLQSNWQIEVCSKCIKPN